MMTSVFRICDKNDFTNASLDPFEDPQETPVANKDDPIRTNTDK